MRINKYLPAKMYGFCVDDAGNQVFFYLSVFTADKRGVDRFVPPIPDEPVDVTYEPPTTPGREAPRAIRVLRLDHPEMKTGIVDGFDAECGYGFIKGGDAQEYYLHRSEVQDGRLPIKGHRVWFYVGTAGSKLRPRACYVTIL